jgi:hypothetical protein
VRERWEDLSGEDRTIENDNDSNHTNVYYYCEYRNAAALLDSHNPAAR